jgi:hypothetical protein
LVTLSSVTLLVSTVNTVLAPTMADRDLHQRIVAKPVEWPQAIAELHATRGPDRADPASLPQAAGTELALGFSQQ